MTNASSLRPLTLNPLTIPPGFRQTEVGVIPTDWEVKLLREISPRQCVGLVINPSTYFDRAGTVPILVGSHVSENIIDATTANRITKVSNVALSASRLSTGDLVTVRVGEPGITAVVPPELDGCNCASMMIVRQDASFRVAGFHRYPDAFSQMIQVFRATPHFQFGYQSDLLACFEQGPVPLRHLGRVKFR